MNKTEQERMYEWVMSELSERAGELIDETLVPNGLSEEDANVLVAKAMRELGGAK